MTSRGVMFPNAALSMKQIIDGTSKTIIVAELRADPQPGALRGIWALPLGPSGLFAHGSNCQARTNQWDVGPNYAGDATGATGDRVNGCSYSAQAVNLGMSCASDGWTPMIGPKSAHPGGLQMVFCDGSVHWMDETISTGASAGVGGGIGNANCLSYYEYLFLASDNYDVPQDVYNN